MKSSILFVQVIEHPESTMAVKALSPEANPSSKLQPDKWITFLKASKSGSGTLVVSNIPWKPLYLRRFL